MFNTFPDLLTYSFFAPTLLRVAVGAVFLYVALMQYRHRGAIAHLHFPLIGGGLFVALAVIFHTVVGAMLVFGYCTQIAAIAAIVGLVIGLWLNRRHPSMVIISQSTVWVLIVICLSLLLSGAGALAYDLRL